MLYPRLRIDPAKIEENTLRFKRMAEKQGVEIVGVTKGVAAYRDVVEAMIRGGITIFADSRLENLARIEAMSLQVELYLLRLPMVSQAKEVVKRAHLSFNSQEVTLRALSKEAQLQGRIHQVMLMVDVGDLREGVLPSKLLPLVEKTLSLKGLELVGLATNVGCYGGILPSLPQLEELQALSLSVKKRFGYPIKIISGGNTATSILFSKGFPDRINQLRIGEGILVGFDSTNNRALDEFHQDAFCLDAEIIEIEEKPSYPIGEIGRDAFGEIPHFQDQGIQKRAILAIGRQDVEFGAMAPLLEGAQIIGGSSDHLIVDITLCRERVEVGQILSFQLSYSAILRAMTSTYVQK